ncbi:universal stress protein [Bacteriovoracaceae bacterium]|nr:universal stress protein [Bacteriovoracaceae bacterium]
MNKKLMVCVDLTDQSLNIYRKHLRELNLNEFTEIHLIHAFQIQVYSDLFYIQKFPSEEEFQKIKESTLQVMKTLEADLGPIAQGIKLVYDCLLVSSPKTGLKDYAQENDISVMAVSTRGKKGVESLFSSSLAEYMVRHAPCELIILRETNE